MNPTVPCSDCDGTGDTTGILLTSMPPQPKPSAPCSGTARATAATGDDREAAPVPPASHWDKPPPITPELIEELRHRARTFIRQKYPLTYERGLIELISTPEWKAAWILAEILKADAAPRAD
ncbi:hypothetical protein M446_4107 [Methylobacterium sp. 4-46]|uniref:hypothetical protein n=1 Tax=unclassified Methylobacterium TaxID=2615210 RepID=UPI000152E272|nr:MULTISPECIES: hypothetical protein [Methylobacterium]ACA18465.1 hypothetical protein M446_4107 [Methylobacterium sp. 4-46]WFT77755.1 hypothetical protein QA634_20865 [Methylobacterium nodulans]